jgi:hypothetical protein
LDFPHPWWAPTSHGWCQAASFLRQPTNQIAVVCRIGKTAWGILLAIVLPQARPAIAVGVSLALMECRNDMAAVGFFGVPTPTFGIYTTWLNRRKPGRGHPAGRGAAVICVGAAGGRAARPQLATPDPECTAPGNGDAHDICGLAWICSDVAVLAADIL